MSELPNEVIAKMNDHAFKAIERTGLSKVLDKRALKNAELYAKLESDVTDIVSKFKIDELSEKHKEIVESIGECPISCYTLMEALVEGQCMCIGLQVERPEAAIADPSRLVIRDIVPVFTTSDSFLNTA